MGRRRVARARLNLTAATGALMVETIRQGLEQSFYQPNVFCERRDRMAVLLNGDLVFWHGGAFDAPVPLRWYPGEDRLR